ncbi:MAG: type II secretion system F family protein [Candidatus Aceula lacicola]|nr:type II secretion system F family protein [Candidatus Aceula lacicola]
MATKMDEMFVQAKEKKMVFLYVLAPFFLGAIAFLTSPQEYRLLATIAGGVIGFVFPSFYIKSLAVKRKKKFYAQLVDALMMLNSALKGGLSLLQAMEVVADEMPDPISQEFAILIGENKMGVSLETSFDRLYGRMGTPALQQFISAVLLARETGGNLPVIFNRIIATIRENRKIQQNIETMTLQGKIQGFVMSLLPVAFGVFVYTSSPQYFDTMMSSEIGKNLLILAAFLQIIGTFLIIKISKISDF